MYFILYCKGYRITWDCLVAASHLTWLLARDLFINIWDVSWNSKAESNQPQAGTETRQ